ncbi:MAG: hypothetical protein IKQ92_10475 [Clostridia bacterium]|nr:hypothetical protein [Clostridia bacterium]
MKVIDVYEQYFAAHAEVNGVERRGVKVTLTATSEEGNITYEAAATFFPYRDPEDFVISYDAVVSKVLHHAKGRRSKKREEAYLKIFQAIIDELASSIGAEVYWDKPLREARRG